MDPTPTDTAHGAALQGTGPGDSTLVISALSRPLDLGTLYNARNDQLIPGISLWKSEDIKNKTHVSPQPKTRFNVSASESLSEKIKLLDVSASVKLSFYSGLIISAGGFAKYLNEKNSSTRQCSVTLNYHETTEVRELMLTELGAPNPEVLNKTDATHVVCQVIYGANALMEFQETARDASSKQDIQGKLNLMINKIPGIGISGEGSLDMKDEDKEKVKNMSCRFYGDFHLQELPTTFEEAVKVYKELPSLLREKGEQAVPVKVWMYPLSKLGDTNSKLKTMISDHLVLAVENVMVDFHQAEIRTNDLLERSRQIKAEDIVHKLEQFQSSLRVFTVEFLQKMGDLIPAIRGGEKEETTLRDLLKSQDASGFSEKEMNKWLDGKETEINIVSMNINKLKSEIKPPGPELNSFLMDPDVTDAFVFSFTSLKYEEPYLKKISQAAENFKSGSTTCSTPELDPREEEDVPWYRRPEVKEALDSACDVFNKATLKNKVISFISDPEYPGASVQWYHEACLKDPHVTNPFKVFACEFTLDPNTANRHALLSEGNRKVTYVSEEQPYPDHPDRFDNNLSQVLSTEALPGRCYWECEWSGGPVDVGVAYMSMSRSEYIRISAKAWSLACDPDTNRAWHNGNMTVLPHPPAGSRRVGVYLDLMAGTLSFYRVSSDTLTHLHTFTITFTNEPLHAAFYVGGDSVSLL
ncbi:stonustoxin subunit alpha-like [Alosa pseudoharengus]|uniref:stonustoxin subunit alpha-like n=1 Tax=Alosa pseudoharengus TaxID=34774 RepID=UPI003F8B2A0E